MSKLPFHLAIGLGLVFQIQARSIPDNWHQWRGPESSGVSNTAKPPLQWNESTNIQWKTGIVGHGSSAPIIWGDKVFILTAIDTGKIEPSRPKPEDQPKRVFDITNPNTTFDFVVLCLDRNTGKQLWRQLATSQVPNEGTHSDNNFASASPVTDGERLYCWFGSAGLFCYNLDGKELWKRDLGPVKMGALLGEGSSPALHEGKLVIVRDHQGQSTIETLDARTGATLWKKDRDEGNTWATPLIVEHSGRTQVITSGSNKVRSYDLNTGDIIWQCGGLTQNAIPCPVVEDGTVYCMTGYQGYSLLALPLSAKGDITGSSSIAWSADGGTPYVPSPLLYGGLLFFNQSNQNIWSSRDAKTGEMLTDRERLPSIPNLYASPVGADGRVYVVGRNGTTLVLERSRTFKVLATNQLDDTFHASPSLAGDQLFLRGRKSLYCLRGYADAAIPATVASPNAKLLAQIETRPLPEGYHGSRHQEFVDGVMEKMKPEQRARVGQLWKEKEQADPGMSNRGASFVRILMFVAEGEKSDALPARAETPKEAWFRQPDARDQPVVKAHLPAGSRRKPGHPMFLSPQSDPVALHAGRLFVVNTPAATLDIIETGTKRVVSRVPVGLDPVCVKVRPDGREVWVANHISDSVSVVDNDPQSPTYLTVVATLQDIDLCRKSTRFDEPVGIAFAGNDKAYVALSSSSRIAVIDVASRRITKHLAVPSREPRAIQVRNGRLYVIPFESNNQTQLSGGRPADIDGKQVTFDDEKLAAAFDSAGFTVDIIKHPEIPDRDLYVFDTATDKLVQTVNSLGTLQYGFDVDADGTVWIAHTDARNHVNGRAGTMKHGLAELENRPYLNRIAKVSPDGKATIFPLNPLPPEQPDRTSAIATPFDLHVEGGVAYLVAAGSDHLALLDAGSGEVLSRVKVGAVPRGVLVDPGSQTAWVFNAADNSVTQVAVASVKSPAVLATISLYDPTPARTKAGLIAFNTARASSNGTFSCASCHSDGHTDQLLWVLNTPHLVGADQIEPRLSQTLRGLRGTAPYHWDGVPGDPYGGGNASTHKRLPPNCDINDPASCVRDVINGGMASTMLETGSEKVNDEGKKGYLSAKERDAMAAFLLDLPHVPPRGRAYTDQLSDDALTGVERFHITGNRDHKNKNTMVCGSCHAMPYLTTDQGSMNPPSFRGALDRFIQQAQGRQNIISRPGYKELAEKGWPADESWRRVLLGGEPGRLDSVIDMFKESSMGFSGALGRQVTLDQQTAGAPLTVDLLPALERAAMEGAIVLNGHGTWLKPDTKPVTVELDYDASSERFVSVNASPSAWSHAELLKLASAKQFIGTFTAHHPGDVASPPPALWTTGSMHQQRSIELFPRVNDDRPSMKLSARYLRAGAALFVNGRRVNGTITVTNPDSIEITFAKLPGAGLNTLQVQNPDSYLSNEFIFFVETEEEAIRRYEREPAYWLTALLNSAIVNDSLGEARLALRAGAELNAPHEHFEFERPPIVLAAMYGRGDLVGELLRHGANPNIQDKDGISALHEAARLGWLEICRKLLDAGARVDVTNKHKERPSDLTRRFIREGDFEKHFAPYNVNVTLDHERYLREQEDVEKLLTATTK